MGADAFERAQVCPVQARQGGARDHGGHATHNSVCLLSGVHCRDIQLMLADLYSKQATSN